MKTPESFSVCTDDWRMVVAVAELEFHVYGMRERRMQLCVVAPAKVNLGNTGHRDDARAIGY
jgi:hypothetical protein